MEDPCGVNGGEDDLFVDELLDFSNGFSETEDPPENRSTGSVYDAPPPPPDNFSLSDIGSLHESELSVQGESLENLEWLSHFVEDSFPDYSLPPGGPAENRSQAAAAEPRQHRFATPVRPRAGVVVLSPSSSTAAPPKKPKRKLAEGGGDPTPRRCAHCGVTKTPQWRTGPFGPKTLCNACGVRHNSGRLLPEYRPACSPSFSTEMHSNNHRKVLEMRRKKEAGDSE